MKKKKTLKKYVVSVWHTQHSTGERIIGAESLALARLAAEEMSAADFDCEPQDGELYVSDVVPATPGDVQLHAAADASDAARERLELNAEDLYHAALAARAQLGDLCREGYAFTDEDKIVYETLNTVLKTIDEGKE